MDERPVGADPDEQIGSLLLIPSTASKRYDFSRSRLARDASDDQAVNVTNDREWPRSTRTKWPSRQERAI
jgi:hypothetical protein